MRFRTKWCEWWNKNFKSLRASIVQSSREDCYRELLEMPLSCGLWKPPQACKAIKALWRGRMAFQTVTCHRAEEHENAWELLAARSHFWEHDRKTHSKHCREHWCHLIYDLPESNIVFPRSYASHSWPNQQDSRNERRLMYQWHKAYNVMRANVHCLRLFTSAFCETSTCWSACRNSINFLEISKQIHLYVCRDDKIIWRMTGMILFAGLLLVCGDVRRAAGAPSVVGKCYLILSTLVLMRPS